jgi:hypothetical protein
MHITYIDNIYYNVLAAYIFVLRKRTLNTVELLYVELQGKQKNIWVIEVHFSCLSFSWTYIRLMSFCKKNMVKDLRFFVYRTFCIPSWNGLAGQADPLGGSSVWPIYCSWKLTWLFITNSYVTSCWWTHKTRYVDLPKQGQCRLLIKSQVLSIVEMAKTQDHRVIRVVGRLGFIYVWWRQLSRSF